MEDKELASDSRMTGSRCWVNNASWE